MCILRSQAYAAKSSQVVLLHEYYYLRPFDCPFRLVLLSSQLPSIAHTHIETRTTQKDRLRRTCSLFWRCRLVYAWPV